MPSGGIGTGVFYTTDKDWEEKKIIMKISLDFP